MKCRECGHEYWIHDDGPEVAGEKYGRPDEVCCREWELADSYSYAAGLCFGCHDAKVKKQQEEQTRLSTDEEPPF